MADTEKKFINAFNHTRKIGAQGLAKLARHFDSLEGAWRASASEFVAAGLTHANADAVAAARGDLDPDALWEALERESVALITQDDDTYPALLRTITDPPYAIYVKGALPRATEKLIGIVGTRRVTAYGKEATGYLSRELARAGFGIVSGMAVGVDALALKAARDEGARVYGVLGCGIDVPYPSQNQQLAQSVTEQGALISEFALGVTPEIFHFPMRNRIIAGMSAGTLVVEARERSGALITGNLALEYNREVFAVPGPIFSQTSRGTHKLIQQGAKLVQEVNDILREFGLEVATIRQTLAQNLSPEEEKILAALADDARHLDEIIQQSALPAAAVHASLTVLEIKGAVRHMGGSVYALQR